MDYFYLEADLVCNPKHRRLLGNAIWLLLWIEAHRDSQSGQVKDYSDDRVASDLKLHVSTIRRWRWCLEAYGYTIQSKRNGTLYLIRAANGLIKVGLTTGDIEDRLAALRAQSPIELTLIHTIRSEDVVRLEAELHQRYSGARDHGEWFALSDGEIEDIQNL